MQMTAYCLLAAEVLSKPATHGIFLFGEKGRKIELLEITDELRKDAVSICKDIIDMLDMGVKPHSDASMHQCMQCEYLNHCNDRGE